MPRSTFAVVYHENLQSQEGDLNKYCNQEVTGSEELGNTRLTTASR